MKRQIQIWGSRALMLLALLFVAQRWGFPLYKQYFTAKKSVVFVPTAKVKSGQFTVSFHEIGTLDAEKSVPVYGDDDGKIIKLIDEGAIVKPGDTICEMDTTQVARDVRNQKLTLKNAEADVERAKSELAILKLSDQTELDKQQADYDFNANELEMAKKTLAKKKRLADEKLIPRDQVDQAELDVRSKELARLKGEKDLELKKKDNQSKESQKDAEVKKVQFASDIQKRNLDELEGQVNSGIIKAPAAGMVVISKTWAEGDFRKLQAGDSIHHRQTICQLPDLTKMLVKVNVGESDAPRVKIGMRVLVKLEAIPDKTFHGVVKAISSLATEGNPWETGSSPGRKNFEVTVELKEANPKMLKPGMTADSEFICDAIPNALSVPLEAVIERDGKTYVFVKNSNGGYTRTRVKTSKYNDNFIIITSGLKKGQVVALRDPTRPMDMQEAGSSGPGSPEDKNSKEQPASLPSVPSTGATKK